MACNLNSTNLALGASVQPNPQPCSSLSLLSSNLSSNPKTKCPKLLLSSQSSLNSSISLCFGESLILHPSSTFLPPNASNFRDQVVGSAKLEPLKIMISGAPASGKGTQCQLITQNYDLAHIAAGDLLRAEVSGGTENGKRAREYMDKGQLVPDEIILLMVKERLSQQDSQEKGWLLDGYPRSSSQAIALKEFGFEPDLFILLEVPEEILVERVVRRRLDPFTGKIYHLTYSPPETEDIALRLTQRFDDTEEKVKLRLLHIIKMWRQCFPCTKKIQLRLRQMSPRKTYLYKLMGH